MKKWLIGLLVVAAAVLGIGWLAIDKDMRALAANLPTNRNVLFWTIPERDAAFRAMDRLPVLAQEM